MSIQLVGGGIVARARVGRRTYFAAITPKDRAYVRQSTAYGSWIVRMGPIGVWAF
jgi:hypothetical protein